MKQISIHQLQEGSCNFYHFKSSELTWDAASDVHYTFSASELLQHQYTIDSFIQYTKQPGLLKSRLRQNQLDGFALHCLVSHMLRCCGYSCISLQDQENKRLPTSKNSSQQKTQLPPPIQWLLLLRTSGKRESSRTLNVSHLFLWRCNAVFGGMLLQYQG